MTDLFVAPQEETAQATPQRAARITQAPPPEPDIAAHATIPMAPGPVTQQQITPQPPPQPQVMPVEEHPAPLPKDMFQEPVGHASPQAHFQLGHPFEGQQRNAIPLFASFWQNPQGIYFDTQEVDEHILLFLRRHFITNLNWVLLSISMSLLPIVGFFLSQTTAFIFPLPNEYLRILVIMYYLFILTYGFIQFLSWYFNISLITAKRVLDIELEDLVYKKISATKISLVQDINYEQTGTLRALFNYGDVLIQTASALDNFYVHSVPRPDIVVRVVESLIGRREGDEDHGV